MSDAITQPIQLSAVSGRVTPLMEQYFAIKNSYQQALVFFQVGDFYELFFDDAKKASAVLGIALTKRGTHNGDPVPLCGVPIHVLEHHLTKLVKAGYHVAICDQLEEARPGMVVKRGVTRVLTPGTLTDSKLLDAKRASYLCALLADGEVIAVVFAELLTGQLMATLLKADDVRGLETQLQRFMPDEIVVGGAAPAGWQKRLRQMGFTVSEPVSASDGGGGAWAAAVCANQSAILERSAALKLALEELYAYLKKNQEAALGQFKTIQCYRNDDYMVLDAATQRNLELIFNTHDGGALHTLCWVLDHAVTPMGSRAIKKWLTSPLVNQAQINHRLDAVAALVRDIATTQQLVERLAGVGDIERVVGRIALERTQVYDYVHLTAALKVLPTIRSLVRALPQSTLLERIGAALGDFSRLLGLLESSINNDSAHDWLIKPGFDAQLDQLREMLSHEHEKLMALERAEQEKTGITSLKVRYNQVHGYYIEVTKPNVHLVPDYYRRHQTLVNAERFTTPDLENLEHQLVKARTQLNYLEQEVYNRVKSEVFAALSGLRQTAYALAHIDALIGFALTAYDQGYCRPIIEPEGDIVIVGGRHPVVGSLLGVNFITNDTALTQVERLWLVTGPNMGGKSTYLRQVALICIMAQCGSFVPAVSAQLPILDRVFTRVGAGDNLAEGKSTFLVEMEETATICRQATAKSLVILDEVGRGTSTYDGLAIAQAVVEYLHQVVKSRCLFATHYHELTHLPGVMPGIANYHVASRQGANGIIFLHKVVPGAATGSFGLEVAQLAQLPPSLVARARQVLRELNAGQKPAHTLACEEPEIFAAPPAADWLIDEIKQLDIDNLTPRQAHELLGRLKDRLKNAP